MIFEFLFSGFLIDDSASARALSLGAHDAFRIAGRAWIVWVVCWIAMAFFSKSTKRRESPAQRLEHVIHAGLGFALIFRGGFGGDFLSRRIIPEHSSLPLLCVIFTILGLLFSVWARFALGSNWSGTVTIKTGHRLIRRGPYRWIRHPIYTGMLTALLATAIVQGLLNGLSDLHLFFSRCIEKHAGKKSFSLRN